MTSTTRRPPPLPSKSVDGISRIFESKLFWGTLVSVLFALPLSLSLMRPPIKQLPVLGNIGTFNLLNQDGRKFGNAEISGSVLLVNFVFTRCPDTCPVLTKTMASVQHRLRGSGKSIQLLSISVDPEHDTPAVLKAYAKNYKADFSVWNFITGDKDKVHEFVVKGFASPIDVDAGDAKSTAFQIAHGEHFVVVDQLGQIRSYQQISSSDDINKVLRDLAIIVNTPPKT